MAASASAGERGFGTRRAFDRQGRHRAFPHPAFSGSDRSVHTPQADCTGWPRDRPDVMLRIFPRHPCPRRQRRYPYRSYPVLQHFKHDLLGRNHSARPPCAFRRRDDIAVQESTTGPQADWLGRIPPPRQAFPLCRNRQFSLGGMPAPHALARTFLRG